MANNALIQDTDKFLEYRYTITEFFIIINGVSTEFPIERISSFSIESMYEQAIFPLFKIVTSMEPSKYYNILKNKDNVKFKVRIQAYYNEFDSTEKSIYRDVINDTFILFPIESAEDFEKNLKKDAGTYDDENQIDKIDNIVELFLFKEDVVTGLRSTINAIPSNCTLSTVVAYLLSKAKATHVLMSPFENTKQYSDIILPPMPIEKTIRFLNNNYGFHKAGTIVYFGLFHSYIINCASGCTAWSNDEWKETLIYVLDATNPKSKLSSVIRRQDEKKYFFNVVYSAIDISNPTVSSNVISGTDAHVIDMQNNNTQYVESNATVVGNKNATILFNDSSNPYMPSAYAAQQKANSVVITMSLQHVNIEAFNPNKTFSLIFENASLNAKYKGVYRIASAIHIFSGSKENFTINTNIVLKKVS